MSTTQKSGVIRFGHFEADLYTRELRKHGLKLKLQEQPFQVLAMLLERPGELVTRDEIRAKLWPQDTFVDFDHGLNAAVRRLREALNDNAGLPRFVETLPRRGYRFIAPAERAAEPDEAPAASAETPQGKTSPLRRWGHAYPAGPGWILGFIFVCALIFILAVPFVFKTGVLHDGIFGRLPPRIHSIAVLPFENIPQDPSHEYFADGMTDELITELSKISALRVTARTSSMAYRGSKRPLREIGRELAVEAVVEGTVEQAGGRVRINAELVNVSTGRNFWAASYERDSKDVLSLQSDVAEAIAKQIQVKVAPQERRRLQAVQTVNPSAYDAYLRGRYLFDQRRGREAHLSTQYYREAIKLQPDYARAYAGLSMSLISQTFLGAARPNEVMPEARATARHALQLDPDIGEAYTALGTIELTYDWSWKAAKQDLQRGIQLNPNDPFGRILYAVYCAAVGRRQEAVAEAQQAVKLDPVSFFANRNLASMLYFNRQYDGALEQLERTRELHDDPAVIDNWVSWIDIKKHLYRRAVQADLRVLGVMVPVAAVNACRAAYDNGGWPAYCKATIKSVLPKAEEQCVPYYLGMSYARLGYMSSAFRWLNRAVDQHCISVVWLAVDPQLDAIRSDPRFKALLRRIRLPSEGGQPGHQRQPMPNGTASAIGRLRFPLFRLDMRR